MINFEEKDRYPVRTMDLVRRSTFIEFYDLLKRPFFYALRVRFLIYFRP